MVYAIFALQQMRFRQQLCTLHLCITFKRNLILDHLASNLKQVVQALCLSLGLLPGVTYGSHQSSRQTEYLSMQLTPDIDTMPSDQNGRCVWVPGHCLIDLRQCDSIIQRMMFTHSSHALGQIFFKRRVVNYRYFEGFEELQCLSNTAQTDTLNHLLVRNSEARSIARKKEGQKYCRKSAYKALLLQLGGTYRHAENEYGYRHQPLAW